MTMNAFLPEYNKKLVKNMFENQHNEWESDKEYVPVQ